MSVAFLNYYFFIVEHLLLISLDVYFGNLYLGQYRLNSYYLTLKHPLFGLPSLNNKDRTAPEGAA